MYLKIQTGNNMAHDETTPGIARQLREAKRGDKFVDSFGDTYTYETHIDCPERVFLFSTGVAGEGLIDFKENGERGVISCYRYQGDLLSALPPKEASELPPVSPVAYIPYQRCPICDGAGEIPSHFTVAAKCPTCNGSRIIPMHKI